MSVDALFDPEKLSIVDFRYVQGRIDMPEYFALEHLESYKVDSGVELSFSLEDRLVKSVFDIRIQTDSLGKNPSEGEASFRFTFIYHVDNLTELVATQGEAILEANKLLVSAISAITYSTCRGILLTRLQGTALEKFILPVVDPKKLQTPKSE